MELKGKKINFLGDSITEGCGTSAPERIFLNLMAAREGFLARNYGIGGTRIARQIDPLHDIFAACFCDRVADMDPDADIVVVFGGTNDYGHGTAPVGRPEDRTPDSFWGACHSLIRSLREKYPAAELVFMSPLHCTGEDQPGRYSGRPLKLYVDILRTVCEQYSVPVCDLFALSGISPEIPCQKERYMPDGLHPSDLGHELIASRLTGFLRAL